MRTRSLGVQAESVKRDRIVNSRSSQQFWQDGDAKRLASAAEIDHNCPSLDRNRSWVFGG